MRALIWITAVLSLAYGGYWAVASSQVRAGATQALDEMRAEGRADYSALSLTGFPSRFDLTITDPVFAGAQASWRAPFLQVFALSYRPNHIIAVWPHEQTLAVAGQRIAVTSDDMRASAVFGAQTALPLDRSTFVAGALRLGLGRGLGPWPCGTARGDRARGRRPAAAQDRAGGARPDALASAEIADRPAGHPAARGRDPAAGRHAGLRPGAGPASRAKGAARACWR